MIAWDMPFPDQILVFHDCPDENLKPQKKWSWGARTSPGSGQGKQNPVTLLFLLLYILLVIAVIVSSKVRFYRDSKNNKNASIDLNFIACPVWVTKAQKHIITPPHWVRRAA